MIVTQTSYRLSLFGGGSDYPEWFREHGGSCLAATINKFCTISARWLPPFFAHRNRIVWSKIELVKARSEIEHPAVRAALEMLDLDGVEIHHDGDLPARSGIGSSSAFAVGLLHALSGLLGIMAAPERLAEDAIRLERILGEHIGIQDQILCALGGFRLLTIERDGMWRADPVILGSETRRALEERLLLFYTGPRAGDLGAASGRVASRSGPENLALARIQQMPAEALRLLDAADFHGFGELLDESWWRKKELGPGISTPEIDDLYATARRAGASGGKITGSGGGGFLLLCVEPQFQTSVLRTLAHLVHVPFCFESGGSRIAYYREEAKAMRRVVNVVTEYRWANEVGAHSMPHPDELRWLGFDFVLRDGQPVRDPRYPESVLMRRDR